VALAGTDLIGFKTLSEAFTNVGLVLEQAKAPIYIHLYFDKIDSLCHEYGPDSPQVEAEIETFLLMMEYYFERMFKQNKRILFLMTAGHGVAEVDPKTTVYLNQGPAFVGFERFLKTNRQGKYIVPAGSPRDMFLYIKDGMLGKAQEFLEKRLQGRADVVRTDFLINEGYFGPKISERFLDRVGNLVLLPYLGESVWWYEKDKFEMVYYGHHGGLTPQEMETVLCMVER
jgi:predicted AlkP superfamily pyrophosphatase or phosphodiesterase